MCQGGAGLWEGCCLFLGTRQQRPLLGSSWSMLPPAGAPAPAAALAPALAPVPALAPAPAPVLAPAPVSHHMSAMSMPTQMQQLVNQSVFHNLNLVL